MIVVAACILLVVATTVLHYEVLAMLSARLPDVRITSRLKVLVVLLVTFASHMLQILMYAAAIYALVHVFGLGSLSGEGKPTALMCIYYSAETFTSLGYGDIVPHGEARLLAGVETLNGLLLIGWSASYLYISMERFWKPARRHGPGAAGRASPAAAHEE